MKITTTDQPSTTQVSDTDGKDDESINKDEVLEQNIQHIKKMRTSRDQEPTWWILKHNIQQIYHTIIKEWGQPDPEKLLAKSYQSISNNLKMIMKMETHQDIQPTQDHWKTYKQIQTNENTMRGITKTSTGYHIIETLYKRL